MSETVGICPYCKNEVSYHSDWSNWYCENCDLSLDEYELKFYAGLTEPTTTDRIAVLEAQVSALTADRARLVEFAERVRNTPSAWYHINNDTRALLAELDTEGEAK